MEFAAFTAIKSLGATESQAILVSYALPIGHLLAVFWPRIMARRRRIPFAFWSDLIGYLFLLPVALAVHPLFFISLVFVAMLLRSTTVTALSGIVRENYQPDRRAKTVGTIQSASLGLMAVSGAVFGLLLDQDHDAYRYLFPLTALMGVIAALQLRAIPESDPRERQFRHEPSWLDFIQVFRRDRDFLRYQISFFLFGFAAWMFKALLPLYLAQELEVDYKSGAFALVVVLYGLPFLTSPIWGALIDRFNLLLMRGVFNLVWALSPLLIFFMDSIEGVIIGQIIAGTIQGGSMLIWNLGVNIFAKREEVPTYMSIHQALTGVRGLLAPITGLALARLFAGDAEIPAYRWVFLLTGVIMAVAGIFMIWEAGNMERQGRATTFAHAEQGEKNRPENWRP